MVSSPAHGSPSTGWATAPPPCIPQSCVLERVSVRRSRPASVLRPEHWVLFPFGVMLSSVVTEVDRAAQAGDRQCHQRFGCLYPSWHKNGRFAHLRLAHISRPCFNPRVNLLLLQL